VDRPAFDRELANRVIGKRVLVGLTYERHDGTVDHQSQVHGVVTRADEETIAIALSGTGEVFPLPPDLRSFQVARPGEYRLRSTGEVVVDPDFIANWTITAPAPE
jgi:hypothetical protein